MLTGNMIGLMFHPVLDWSINQMVQIMRHVQENMFELTNIPMVSLFMNPLN